MARERRERYHESRLATEVALLKFNTPFEKREHSLTNTTAGETNYRHSSSSKVGSGLVER